MLTFRCTGSGVWALVGRSRVTAAEVGAVPATGGSYSGPVSIGQMGAAPLTVGQWAEVSGSGGGFVLFGNNVALWSDDTYRYVNSHASIGASGIVLTGFGAAGPYFFDQGDIATTADAAFSPTLRLMYHAGNQLALGTTAADGRTALGLGSVATKNQTVSTSAPSGTPADGDTWLEYTP